MSWGSPAHRPRVRWRIRLWEDSAVVAWSWLKGAAGKSTDVRRDRTGLLDEILDSWTR
jgi:hypothetical protein